MKGYSSSRASLFVCSLFSERVLSYLLRGNQGLRSLVLRRRWESLLGTQQAHKHKHFMGISLPYWASL